MYRYRCTGIRYVYWATQSAKKAQTTVPAHYQRATVPQEGSASRIIPVFHPKTSEPIFPNSVRTKVQLIKYIPSTMVGRLGAGAKSVALERGRVVLEHLCNWTRGRARYGREGLWREDTPSPRSSWATGQSTGSTLQPGISSTSPVRRV